jgi:hypothetical protein
MGEVNNLKPTLFFSSWLAIVTALAFYPSLVRDRAFSEDNCNNIVQWMQRVEGETIVNPLLVG